MKGESVMRSVYLFCAVVAPLVLSAWAKADDTLAGGPVLQTKLMQDINAATLPWNKQYPQDDVVYRRRPWTAADDGGTLLIQNLRIHDATNLKAMHVSVNSANPKGGAPWTYSNVIVRNVEAYNINRDERTAPDLHMDFLLMDGWSNQSARETNVLIEDVYFHDGDALSMLIKDAKYGTITIRRMKVANTTTSIHLDVIHGGYIKKVVIEDSPGLRVSLEGPPGSIGQTIVRNSPGADVACTKTMVGFAGAEIIYDNSPMSAAVTAPVPEPGTLGVLMLGALMLISRKRA